MKDNLDKKLNLHVENVNKMKKAFIMQPDMIRHLSALMYTAEGKEIDAEAVRRCHKLIKTEAGMFSYFKGNLAVGVATLLSLSEDPQQQLERALEVYSMMKKNAGFMPSDYLAMAAYQIAAGTEPDRYEEVISRARKFYDGMKKHHWMMTGKDDYIFTAMMSLMDIPVQPSLERMEEFFDTFRNDALVPGKIHALSQVLVLGGENTASVQRVRELRENCRQKGCRLDQEYTYPIMGVLSMMPGTTESIAADLFDAYSFLREQKGFGSLSMSKQALTMFAASIVAYTDTDELKDGVTDSIISKNIASIIMAQEATMMAAVMVFTVTSSSSSSSTNS